MMVTRIPAPIEDPVVLVGQIIDERIKHKDFYTKIRTDLIAQLELYQEFNGNPEQISPLDLTKYTSTTEEEKKRKQSLINLYSPKENTLPYSQLEKMRKHNGLVICPSCGEAGRPRTLDHYLPKDSFPELAVFLTNLTPMCDWCQGEKLTDYITNNGKKRYIHPYFDDVDKPLLKIKFHPPYDSPVIEILVIDNLPSELKELVTLHIEGISLLERYKEFFKTKYRQILRGAEKCRIGNQQTYSKTIQNWLELAIDDSANSWDNILYRSLIDDPNIMHYLEHEQLPANL